MRAESIGQRLQEGGVSAGEQRHGTPVIQYDPFSSWGLALGATLVHLVNLPERILRALYF
eukprot:722559-Rhodomonas_salina.1